MRKEDDMILFSIIVPTYNVENYIETTLQSICRNQLDQTEIIVIDDGSKDGTKEIAEGCLKKWNPPHYQFISQSNQGVSVARNVGIERSTGKYLIFCDGDDICYSNMIQILTPLTVQDKDMLVWRFDITQNGKRTVAQEEFLEDTLPKEEIFRKFLLGTYRIRLGSFAVKRDLVFENNIRYTVGCPLSQDVEFMFKCLAKVQNILLCNNILFTYAKREGSVMYTYNMNRFEAPRVMKRIYDYVSANTNILKDESVRDYLQNGFLILHSIHAFDSCISYIKLSGISEFWKEYLGKYSDVENEIKRAGKEMKRFPQMISAHRVRLFCKNRKVYIYYSLISRLLRTKLEFRK